MSPGYTASFSSAKGGLATAQRAYFDSDFSIIGSWDSVDELQAGSGIYYIFENPPGGAYWLGWRTGDSPEYFLLHQIEFYALVFNFGQAHSGKSIAYQFTDEDNVPIESEITSDIFEFMTGTGIYYARNVVVPDLAEFIKARTVEASPIYIGGSLDRPFNIYYQVPKDGPYVEEKEL